MSRAGNRAGRLIADSVADVMDVAVGWRWGRRRLVPRGVVAPLAGSESSVFPTGWARQVPARVVREAVQLVAVRPMLHSQLYIDVQGLDAIASLKTPVILVPNHSSHLDAALILDSLPPQLRRTTAVAAAADYFFDSWWRAGSSAIAFNSFPIERQLPMDQAGRADPGTQKGSGTQDGSGAQLIGESPGGTTPARLLAAGWNVIIFPEGTRSADGFLGPFAESAAELAIAHHVPVVPIGMRGTYAAMPRGRSWPAPGRPRVGVRYGSPIRGQHGESAAELTGRLAAGVQRLIDEDSGTWWEVQKKASQQTATEQTAIESPAASWRRIWQQSAEPAKGGRSAERPIWH